MKRETQLNLTVVQSFIDNFIVETINSVTKKPEKHFLNSKTRVRKVIYSRMVVFDFLYKNGMTYAGIGKLFDRSGTHGAMDHATVRHQIKQLEESIMYRDVLEIYNEVTENIKTRFFVDSECFLNDICLKELVSLCNIESNIFKNYSNLATSKDSYCFELVING